MSRGALVTALAAVAVWSTNAAAAGIALDSLSVTKVLALQFGGAAGLLLLTRAGRSTATVLPRNRAAILIGVTGLTATIGLQYLAFASSPLVGANAIAYAWPLLVALVALRSTGQGGAAAAALLGLAGVVLVFSERGSLTASPGALLGYTAALGSAVAMAFYTVASSRARAPSHDIVTAGALAGAAAAIPAALIAGGGWGSPLAGAAAVYAGLGPMAIGYLAWTRAMAAPGAADLAPLAYLTPLLSMLVLLAGDQSIGPVGLLGCALIMACGAWTGTAAWRHSRAAPAMAAASSRRPTTSSRA